MQDVSSKYYKVFSRNIAKHRTVVFSQFKRQTSDIKQNKEHIILAYQGFAVSIVFPFGQGFISMSPPSKDFYQFVMEGKMRHGRHPVLDWNIANVIVDEDPAGNIKPNKRKSTEKIDGAVAMIMGLARATLQAAPAGSVYDREDRGILWL